MKTLRLELNLCTLAIYLMIGVETTLTKTKIPIECTGKKVAWI